MAEEFVKALVILSVAYVALSVFDAMHKNDWVEKLSEGKTGQTG